MLGVSPTDPPVAVLVVGGRKLLRQARWMTAMHCAPRATIPARCRLRERASGEGAAYWHDTWVTGNGSTPQGRGSTVTY